ncbi:exopolysaccharide biosynthesis polyprenyl glycosylphosphotransferase [Aestuariibaculum sediminum]|uniref:Exopolysaccharide biosynthesis polyprenyl glycosylphosphotransferase n=1 Tax=Aestuariibaculum sediminum TaxID=2770637 RepID=A0A8J6QK94_9FLAO|nr:exopolysaccharide biosynthesis polyprenyl glycosylphosphotransferase [Aestuariibaculum sediminum]MBD0833109.1 exopolysaccharide biosynthesis polyprenyl glycosylphosphotransferase [Aestuariibaculum sediminum]
MLKGGIHFNISERKVLLRLFDVISTLVVLCFVSNTFDFDYFTITENRWRWVFVLVLYLTVFATVFELYDLQKSSKLDKIATGIVFTVSTTVLFYFLTPFFTPELPNNRLQILYFYFSILFALLAWRFIYLSLIVSPRFNKRILLVGEMTDLNNVIRVFQQSDPHYKIIGYINCEKQHVHIDTIEDISEFHIDNMSEVIKKQAVSEIVVISNKPDTITPEVYHDLMQLLNIGVPVREYSQVYEDITHRVPLQYVGMDFYKYFPFNRNNKNRLYRFLQRVFDILISVFGILFSLVLLPFIIIGNLLANRGKLFYTQKRVGLNGKVFKIIKFRTMIKNAEASGAVWATKNDTRITRFGKFLRYSRIDEIPQFINILKGEMSLIGPRPERPVFVKELSDALPFYETRHIIKPGVTGWAQVKMRYGSSLDDSLEKLQYDLYYIKHRSFLLDVNIMIKTLTTVIFFRGQ